MPLRLVVGVIVVAVGTACDFAQPWGEQAHLAAAASPAPVSLGWAVSIRGTTALVGAPRTSTNPSEAGAAFIFERSGAAWTEVARLQSDQPAAGEHFGNSVCLSGDTAVVGAWVYSTSPPPRAAYIFERVNGAWTGPIRLSSPSSANDQFGFSVAVDGDDLFVGARIDSERANSAGAVYVFRRQAGAWVRVAKLTASDAAANDYFGHAVSISGSHAIIGSWLDDSGAGSAYIFERDAQGHWAQVAHLIPADRLVGDFFGNCVSINGDTAVGGAYGVDMPIGGEVGAAYVYQRSPAGAWLLQARLQSNDRGGNDQFGTSVSIFGGILVVGAPYDSDRGPVTGSAYVFRRSGAPGGWSQIAKLIPRAADGSDLTGQSVSTDGVRVLVGAPWSVQTGTNGTATLFACPADFNDDGSVTSADFFDFLAAFFAGAEDFNDDGLANSQDFFDFLAAFLGGC